MLKRNGTRAMRAAPLVHPGPGSYPHVGDLYMGLLMKPCSGRHCDGLAIRDQNVTLGGKAWHNLIQVCR